MNNPILCLFIIVTVTCCNLFRIAAAQDEEPRWDSGEDISAEDVFCFTSSCIKAAATFLDMMDQTQDPCQDFYEFACGNFVKETVIHDHKITKGGLSDLGSIVNERLRKLFEDDSEPGEPAIFASVRKLYSSCMDQDLLEEVGREILLEKVQDLGGWPVLQGEEWDEENTFIWQDLSLKAERMGLLNDIILSIGYSISYDDSTKRIIEIDKPELGISGVYFMKGFDDETIQAYYRFMVDTAIYLGADELTAEQDLEEALEFEFKLAEMLISHEERLNKTDLNNQMSIYEASKMYPGYDWLGHINVILNSEEVELDEEEIINVAVPNYFIAVGEYLPTVPSRVIANYMMWRYVSSLMWYTDKDGLDILHSFVQDRGGSEAIPPRWETCVTDTAHFHQLHDGDFANAIGSMYVRKYFSLEQKYVAEEMVENIRTELDIILDDLNWMDYKTKERARVKLDHMNSFIAFEEALLDNDLLNDFYEGVELSSDNFLENMLDTRRYIKAYYSKMFRVPIDKTSWIRPGSVAVANAYHNHAHNYILIPAGILDGIYFQADRPAYLNYGGIGVVAAHELTHGFDKHGSQKDQKGNLVDWWEEESREMYNMKAQCIIDQYSNYTVEVQGETLSLNGIRTQSENIADAGAFKAAFRAYEQIVREQGEERKLPGIPYTPKQLFWVSGAAIFCQTSRPEFLKIKVLQDIHSPSSFRVNGALRNSEEFSRAWNCPVDSPMNPREKCNFW